LEELEEHFYSAQSINQGTNLNFSHEIKELELFYIMITN